MNKKNYDLTKDALAPALFSFTVPFLFATLLQTLYGTVDTLTVGNFSSTASLSAVAVGAQVLSLMTFLAYGLSNGATVLLGQSIGAKDEKRAAKIVGNTIIDFAAASILFMVLLLIIYPTALRLLNIPAEAWDEACRYCTICSFGIPLIVGYNTVCALLRAIGDSKSPLIFVGIACVINVAGDLILTGLLGMGAAGVAISTVVAQGSSFLFSLVYIMKKGMGFAFSKSDIKYDSSVTANIFKVGLPMGLQSILINLSFLFITSIINAMGLTASAAMGVGDKIIGIAFLPQNSVCGAVSVVVAQNIGAKKPDRAIKSVKLGMAFCLAIEIVFLVFCQVCPNTLPSLFSSDWEVIVMAGQYMRAYSIDALLTSITFCLAGFMNGCGKTTANMIQNLISTFLGRVPATYLLSIIPGTSLFLIGLAAPISTIMSVIMLFIYIAGGFWKKGLFDSNEA